MPRTLKSKPGAKRIKVRAKSGRIYYKPKMKKSRSKRAKRK